MAAMNELNQARMKALTNDREFYFAVEIHENAFRQPMRFGPDRQWLVDIYRDHHPQITIMKSVQCGISEWLIIHALTACIMDGMSVLYVLPTEKAKNIFSDNRIDGLFRRVPFYKRFEGKVSNKGFKYVGNGKLNIAASVSSVNLTEFPAEKLIIDELDRCKAKNIPLAFDRIAAARELMGREPDQLQVSNPTIEGHGIHYEYKYNSTGDEWLVKCPRCGKWQQIDWFKNIVREINDQQYELRDWEWFKGRGLDIQIYCVKCEGTMPRFASGEWVSQWPDRDAHGYHVSQMFTPQWPLAKLYDDFIKALPSLHKMQRFVNSVLGRPAANRGFKITMGMLADCVESGYMMPRSGVTGCIMGVDIGAVAHVHISKVQNGIRRKVWIGTVPMTKDMKDLGFLIQQFGVEACVIDIRPETTIVKAFQEDYPGIVYLCDYIRGRSVKDAVMDHAAGEIKVDRTQALDGAHGTWRDQQVILPVNYTTIDDGEFTAQMTANTRVLNEIGDYFEWQGDALDHHQHADCYEYMAYSMIYGESPVIHKVSG